MTAETDVTGAPKALTFQLKYGLNPQQRTAAASTPDGAPLPFAVLTGTPSTVNLLDALQGWQLVRAAAVLLGRPVVASIKHVSPAGVAAAGEVDEVTRALFRLSDSVSDVASALARARDCDPRSSYGDTVASSHPIDDDAATLLARVVSDAVIAPDFEPGVVGRLARKKNGAFLVLRMSPDHVPPCWESRDVFGVRIIQDRDEARIDKDVLHSATPLGRSLVEDALLGLLAARHAQSNSVAYVRGGAAIGMGTGQQSRVDCVRLAGEKADRWRIRRHPELAARAAAASSGVQDAVSASMAGAEAALGREPGPSIGPVLDPLTARKWLSRERPCTVASDAFFPFRDNVDVAAHHGACAVVEGGGARRSADVAAACREHGIVHVTTGLRLFYH